MFETKLICEFFVQCTPPSKLNQAKGIRVVRKGKRHIPIVFTKPEVLQEKEQLKNLFRKFTPDKIYDCPLKLDAIVCYSNAKNKKPNGYPKTTSPDGDNILKTLKDVLEDLKYCKVDSRICDERVRRIYNDVAGLYIKYEEILA